MTSEYDEFMKWVRKAQAKLPVARAFILNGTLYEIRRPKQFFKKRRTRSMKGK